MIYGAVADAIQEFLAGVGGGLTESSLTVTLTAQLIADLGQSARRLVGGLLLLAPGLSSALADDLLSFPTELKARQHCDSSDIVVWLNTATGIYHLKGMRWYGTTTSGGQYQDGTVYELTPSGSGWTETVLHSFQSSEGTEPFGTLISDASGNLYGTTYDGGIGGYAGSVFELSPSNGGWAFSVLHLFDFSEGEGTNPVAGVTMDAAGNLYGTTIGGGSYEDGTVYELVYAGGAWTYQTLHDFYSTTGDTPFSVVTFDSQGNLYGTADSGGHGDCNTGCGVVWEITP